MEGSGGEGFVWTDGLVSGLQWKAFLNFVVEELCVLHQLLVTIDTGVTGDAYHLSAVVASVNAGHALKSAGEAAVFEWFHTVVAGLVLVSTLAVNADGCTEGPTTSVTVEAGESTCFLGVPIVDASCDVVCVLVETPTLENLHTCAGHGLITIMMIWKELQKYVTEIPEYWLW